MRRALFAFILFLATLFSGCGNGESAPAAEAPPPLPVKILVVHKKPVPIWGTYTGMSKASSEQVVRARVSGRLLKRFFRDGDIVEKGQKLFLIEPDRYRAALEAARAQKARDEAKLRLAKANAARYRPLVKEGLAPRATLEEFEAQVAEYEAAILADDAQIAEAKLNLSYTLVRAPISGKTGVRRVDVGNLVGYGEATPLVTIMRIDPLYIYFSPSEKEARKIFRYAGGSARKVVVRVPAADERLTRTALEGLTDFSDNTVDPKTSTVTMRAAVGNPAGDVLPGTFVYVDLFITDKYPFFTVPPQALFEDQQGRFVYLVRDGKAVRQSVVPAFSTRSFVAIAEGLKEGDRVIVSGLAKIRDGLPVAPAPTDAEKGGR